MEQEINNRSRVGADIPVILITADCLPEAWERAVLAVWNKGLEVKTQYDKPEDPPSKDATVIVTVTTRAREVLLVERCCERYRVADAVVPGIERVAGRVDRREADRRRRQESVVRR